MSSYDPLEELRATLAELSEAEAEAKRAVSFVLQQVDSAQGCDDTGNVVVTIDAENHIKDSTLDAKWPHAIDPAKLGDGYSEAVEAAREQKDVILANLIAEAEKRGAPPSPAARLEWDFSGLAGSPTRTARQLVDEYLAYRGRPEGRSELGENEARTVSVEANRRGFAWCGIDERWAEEQKPWAIAAGVVEASAAAKAKLARKREEPGAPAAQDIVEDALRLFRQIG